MPLDEGPESPSEEYLCDYLYIDTQRLAHYYSQLSEHGLVTQAKHLSKSGGQEDSTLQAGVPLLGGKLKQGKSSEESFEMQVDPAFRRPQETLDALEEAGYLTRGLGTIGQLCLFEGLLTVIDLRLLKEMWPSVGGMMARQAAEAVSNPKEKQRVLSATKKGFEPLAEILQRMPHSVQGSIASKSGFAWYTLKPEFLMVNPEDLMFKCGSDIPGVWKMVCIVDAYPDHILDTDHSDFFANDIEVAMRQVLNGLRTAFGRPRNRFGITPIMIFRKIEKPMGDSNTDEVLHDKQVPQDEGQP